MAEDPKFELAVLETVYGFYQKLLRAALMDDVPVPIGLDAAAMKQPGSDLVIIALLRRWLRLLDLAISPPMLRQGLGPGQQETAEALLRYYALKKNPAEHDRDKLDFVATYLYRNPRVAGQWETKGYSLDAVAPISPFEIALLEILHDSELPTLPEEHVQLLREFDALGEQVAEFREFDALMESGIIARVREIKTALGRSFYHPHVLAALAAYNASLGKKFDELFAAAAQQIKHFAEKVQEQGGSLMSPVEGEVTVRHLAEVEEAKLLKAEYRHAQEHFRHVSKLKRAVDKRTKGHGHHAPTLRSAQDVAHATHPPVAPSPAAKQTSPPAAPVHERRPQGAPTVLQGRFAANVAASAAAAPAKKEDVIALAPTPSQRAQALALEQGKLRSVEESIRAFVRAADPKFRQIVPMRFGNLVMSAAEADAFCAEHLEEKSFRADNARALIHVVAHIARMMTEMEELKHKQNSAYLWKPHADALVVLLESMGAVNDEATQVAAMAQSRGLPEKVKAMNASLHKLREKSEQVVKLLKTVK